MDLASQIRTKLVDAVDQTLPDPGLVTTHPRPLQVNGHSSIHHQAHAQGLGHGRRRGGGRDRVPDPDHALRLRAELLDADDRARSRADGQDRRARCPTKGIGYQIQNNGTAIAVDSDQTGQARIALATAGLLGVAPSSPASSSLNKQQLGASNFQQQVTYQRALEGQLDQTIEGIQGINSAHREPRPAQPAGPALRRQQRRLQRRGAAVRLRHA